MSISFKLRNDSTGAFACFNRVDGRKEYCDEECKAEIFKIDQDVFHCALDTFLMTNMTASTTNNELRMIFVKIAEDTSFVKCFWENYNERTIFECIVVSQSQQSQQSQQ